MAEERWTIWNSEAAIDSYVGGGMKLEGHVYCEGPDCEHSSHVSTVDMAAGRLSSHGWIKVIEYTSADDHIMSFCGYDCVMKHFAQFPPPEIIRPGEPDG